MLLSLIWHWIAGFPVWTHMNVLAIGTVTQIKVYVHVLAVCSVGAAGGQRLGRGIDTGRMSSWGAAVAAGEAASQSSVVMTRRTASSLVVTGAGCWWVEAAQLCGAGSWVLWCRQLGFVVQAAGRSLAVGGTRCHTCMTDWVLQILRQQQ